MLAISMAIAAVVLIPPFWILLPRAGIPSTVALLAVIPIAAVVLLWILAIRKWPGPGDDVASRF